LHSVSQLSEGVFSAFFAAVIRSVSAHLAAKAVPRKRGISLDEPS
jgi:hypothetical protein